MLWQLFPQKIQVVLVEASSRVMIKKVPRYSTPLKVLSLIEHSWSLTVTDFWGSK